MNDSTTNKTDPPPDVHVRRDGDSYGTELIAYLPNGVAWPKWPGTTLDHACRGLSDYWGTVDGRAADLLETESDPRKASELLPDWERNWELPDPCEVKPPTDEPKRHDELMFKMTLLGRQDRQFFIDWAARRGETVTIREYAPYMCGISRVGDTRIGGVAPTPPTTVTAVGVANGVGRAAGFIGTVGRAISTGAAQAVGRSTAQSVGNAAGVGGTSGVGSTGGGTVGTLIWSDEFDTLSIASPSLARGAGPSGTWRPNAVWQNLSYGYRDFAGTSWNINPNEASTAAYASTAFSVASSILTIRAFRTPSDIVSAIRASLDAQGNQALPVPAWCGGLLMTNSANRKFTRPCYIEWRAQWPNPGKGMFPALWLYASDGSTDAQNKGGAEIDFLEIFGYPAGNPWTSTLHEKANDGQTGPDLTIGSQSVDTGGWHTYGLDWSATYLNFYRDNVLVYSVTGSDAAFYSTNMDIIINFAMDASWFPPSSNVSDASTPSPMLMNVDYVRVYTAKPGTPPPSGGVAGYVKNFVTVDGAGTSSATISGSFSSAVGVNNLVCGMVFWFDNAGTNTISSITDDKGNSYSVLDLTYDTGNHVAGALFYKEGLANGPTTVTLTLATATTYKRICGVEYSGIVTSAALDGHHVLKSANVAGGPNAQVSGSITPTTDGDLILGALVNTDGNGRGAYTAGTLPIPFTQRISTPGTDIVIMSTEDYVQLSAASVQAAFGNAVSNQSNIVWVAAFKPALPAVTTTLDPAQLGPGITLSNGNLTATVGSAQSASNTLATKSATTGKKYYEFTPNVTLGNAQVGLINGAAVRAEYLGQDYSHSAAVNATNGAWLASGGAATGLSGAMINGHTYGVAIDVTNHNAWIKDITAGGNWNGSSSADPVAGTGAATFATISGAIFPAVSLQAAGDKVTFNFGNTAYVGTPPTGYLNWT